MSGVTTLSSIDVVMYSWRETGVLVWVKLSQPRQSVSRCMITSATKIEARARNRNGDQSPMPRFRVGSRSRN